MKTAVIYARYSCDNQTEQSIEGQLRVCEEYASLFVALCRASNIPARVIEGYSAGYMVEGQEKSADDIRHAWAEIYLKGYGWVPSEVTTSITSNIGKIPYWEGFLNFIKKP